MPFVTLWRGQASLILAKILLVNTSVWKALHHKELIDVLQIALRFDKWSSISSNEVQLNLHNSPCNNCGPCLGCATTP